MPTYDFTCALCDEQTSVTQPIDQPLDTQICTKCGHNMVRSFGLSAVTFNGSGWASKEK